jgi:cytochrome c oxidase subunit 2
VKIPASILTLVLGITLTLVSLWYGQNHGLMPVAASEDAKQIDNIFNLMMTIATGLFLIVEGSLIYILIKFRRRLGDQTDGPAIEGNVPLEIFWTAIPTVIVFVLSVYSFEIYNNIGGLNPQTSQNVPQQIASTDGAAMVAMSSHHHQVALGIGPSFNETGDKKPLEVNVKGIQYAWVFTYPETGIVSGELHAPVDRPVLLKMMAGDVIHAFWIPQLRLKQDVMPKRESILGFSADRIGQYPIICAELCGAYHGGMKSMFYVHSQEDYDKWVQENTLAQSEEAAKTLAVNPKNLSDGQFLAPYAENLGINADTVAQAHHHHAL